MACPVCADRGVCRSPGDPIEHGGWEPCPLCHPPTIRPAWWRRAWRWVQARFRLDLTAVCELSRGRGLHDDFHDYPDSPAGEPWHFVTLTCKRCGKEFTI